MADFMTSTHRAKWIFSPQDLKEKYKEANKRAKQTLEKFVSDSKTTFLLWKYGVTRMEVDADGSFSNIEAQNDAKEDIVPTEKHSRPKPLKPEEEQLLKAFYEFKIQDVCDAFKFPRKIQATALIYFKRFYLQWSVMEHHPKNIMLTCIYAACKSEENHVSAEELGKGIEQDHQMILNNEMLVLQSLEFDLIVYTPYRALEGFVSDIEELIYANAKVEQQELLKRVHEHAKLEVDKTMRTEAPLLFPPGQLALAALRRPLGEAPELIEFERYLRGVLSKQKPSHALSEIIARLNSIDMLINKLETPTSKDVKHIDRKLKSCLDPSSHEKSRKRKHRSKGTSTEMHVV